MAYTEGKAEYVDYCICCGAPVPEGRMICANCEISGNNRQKTETKSFKYTFCKIFSKLSIRRNEEQK